MAAVKIGLDFGTHFTKVCIEDSTDRRNRRYIFQRFYDLDGNASFVLPSVVQLNKDGTLSYGFVDKNKVAMVRELPDKDAPKKPEEPRYRNYKIFPEPIKPIAPSYPKVQKNKISDFASLRDAIMEKERQEVAEKWAKEDMAKYEKAKKDYEIKCKQREKAIAKDKEEVDAYNKDLLEVYEMALKRWECYKQKEERWVPATFISFKQMVFSEGFEWRFDVDPMLISIWYLCFVFFDLDREFGTQYLTICMGTSSGRHNWKQNKEKATRIILTVYDLIENVFEHDKDRFLRTTFDELKRITVVKEFSQTEKEDNQIFVFPEAFANLNPLAKQKRFGAGINAVVDIGGGTTDISIFVAPMGEEVQIFDYESIPYGVNAIEANGKDIHFHAVEGKVDRFSMKITKYAQHLGVKQDEATRIISKRPIVFTGGGSMITELRRSYVGFTDIIHMGKAVTNNYSIDDALEVTNIIPMLSTALGLALCDDDRDIPIISYEELFKIVSEAYREKSDETEHAADYGLADL